MAHAAVDHRFAHPVERSKPEGPAVPPLAIALALAAAIVAVFCIGGYLSVLALQRPGTFVY